MISQSSYIAFFLIAGFIIFITIRGEIKAYENIFIGSVNEGATNGK